jgi:hypothetical protein
MRNNTGQPVRGSDFFDREQELRHIRGRLETDNVLLLAPRRVGKTSLMYRIASDAEQARPRLHAVYLSAASLTSEAELVTALGRALAEVPAAREVLEQLRRSWPARLIGAVQRSTTTVKAAGFEIGFREAAESDWRQAGSDLVRSLQAQGDRWLLLVDELPLLVLALLRGDHDSGNDGVRLFLDWFRQLRQAPLRGDDRVRWLLAGSIGLDVVTRRLKLGATINDLALCGLGPFSPETADRLLSALAGTYGLPLTPAVRKRICERVEWLIPYHLQLLFAGLREHCLDRGCDATVATVDEVVEALLAPSRRAYFDYWVQRLHEELAAPQDEHAIGLLTVASRDPDGASLTVLGQVMTGHGTAPEASGQELAWLLDVLVNDGYLVASNGRYRFRSGLLRQYWQRRFSS